MMTLTPRETEVSRLIACGYTDKEIAQKLNIKVNTVRFYVRCIFHKTGLGHRVQIAVLAFKQGIISVDGAWHSMKGVEHV